MPLRMIPYEKPAAPKARRTRRPKGLDLCVPEARALPCVELTGFSVPHQFYSRSAHLTGYIGGDSTAAPLVENHSNMLLFTPCCVWGLLWGICSNEPYPAQTRFEANSATSQEHCETPAPRFRAHNPEVGGSNPSPATKK